MRNSPVPINRQKSASYKTTPGRYYSATVTSVDTNGRVSVHVGSLGASYDKITPMGTTASNKLAKGDTVHCTFSDEYFTDLLVFGHSTIKPDIFETKVVVAALTARVHLLEAQVDALQALCISLGNRITALEG